MMVNTLTKDNQQVEQKPETATTRRYEPEEFDVDTTEERPIVVLAERRRQFLAGLKARQAASGAAVDEVIRAAL